MRLKILIGLVVAWAGVVRGRAKVVRDLSEATLRGEKWPMITAYDALTARLFDDAGIPALLVGDSAAMVVYGHDSTLPVTVDELVPLVRAVVRGSSRSIVIADLPFGSYQASPGQALETAAAFMKDGGAHAVLRATVNDDALGVRITRFVENFRPNGGDGGVLLQVEQRAQIAVLGFEL